MDTPAGDQEGVPLYYGGWDLTENRLAKDARSGEWGAWPEGEPEEGWDGWEDGWEEPSAGGQLKKQQFYKTKVCPWFGRGKCDRGEQCQFAHSETELRRAPDLSKTSLCRNLRHSKTCTVEGCNYAHTLDELRATGELFKTTVCVRWAVGKCAAGNACRHAHGREELRAGEERREERRPRRARARARRRARSGARAPLDLAELSASRDVAYEPKRADSDAEPDRNPRDALYAYENTLSEYLTRRCDDTLAQTSASASPITALQQK